MLMLSKKMQYLLQRLNLHYSRIFLNVTILIFSTILVVDRSWVGEDAFIFFKYVENLKNGNGLVFNLGERVEGFTAPLWVLLLFFLKATTSFELRTISIIAGIFLTISAITTLLIYQFKKQIYFPISVILLVTNSAFRDFGTSGFETSLTYILLVVLLIMIKEDFISTYPKATGLLVALLSLNRPESVLFFPLFLFVIYRRYTKFDTNSGIKVSKLIYNFSFPFVFLVGSYQIFRMGYYASVLPNTFFAKKGGQLNYVQGFYYLRDFVTSYWISSSIIILLTAILFYFKKNYSKKLISDNDFLIFCMGLLPLIYVIYAGGDYMHGRSLLMTFIIFSFLVSGVFEKAFLEKIGLKFETQKLFNLVAFGSIFFIFFLQIQTPLAKIVGNQVSGIDDERRVFGFEFRRGEYFNYLKSSITGEFGWRDRGYYYRDVAESTQESISVVMPNIGFFGFAAGPKVTTLGSSLIDPFKSRFEIEKRGKIGHEEGTNFDYIAYRNPTFAYTPFPLWNKAMQLKYQNSKFSFAITDDSNDSFIPIFDLSNKNFIKEFSRLVGDDISLRLDQEIMNYLGNLADDNVNLNIDESVEFLGFLQLYWYPYTTEQNRSVFDATRQRTIGLYSSSTYEVFTNILGSKFEEFNTHITQKLTIKTFLENFIYASTQIGQTNSIEKILLINTSQNLNNQRVTYENVIKNSEFNFFHTQSKIKKGLITINAEDIKFQSKRNYLKINYRIVGENSYLKVLVGSKVIFHHDLKTYNEISTSSNIYLDITNELKNSTLMQVQVFSPAHEFDTSVYSIELI